MEFIFSLFSALYCLQGVCQNGATCEDTLGDYTSLAPRDGLEPIVTSVSEKFQAMYIQTTRILYYNIDADI